MAMLLGYVKVHHTVYGLFGRGSVNKHWSKTNFHRLHTALQLDQNGACQPDCRTDCLCEADGQGEKCDGFQQDDLSLLCQGRQLNPHPLFTLFHGSLGMFSTVYLLFTCFYLYHYSVSTTSVCIAIAITMNVAFSVDFFNCMPPEAEMGGMINHGRA